MLGASSLLVTLGDGVQMRSSGRRATSSRWRRPSASRGPLASPDSADNSWSISTLGPLAQIRRSTRVSCSAPLPSTQLERLCQGIPFPRASAELLPALDALGKMGRGAAQHTKKAWNGLGGSDRRPLKHAPLRGIQLGGQLVLQHRTWLSWPQSSTHCDATRGAPSVTRFRPYSDQTIRPS